jgi:hypothetical protein
VLALAAVGGAQPIQVQPTQPVTRTLQDANAAAIAGDWAKVAELVDPLLGQPFGGPVAMADVAEAHRLAGLAAFFQHRSVDADDHFLRYLKLDLDARLDPALVPPEAVTFFEDVRARHAAELRALRPRPRSKRYLVLELLPPFGQIQNGEHTKAWLLGAALGGFAIANVSSYLVLRDWCSSSDKTCDPHARAADTLRTVNLVSGIGLLATYAYGVYDGVVEYRRQTVSPFLSPASSGGIVGLSGTF